MSSPLFGIVIPGHPIITDFKPISETKAVTLVPAPATVNEITFFLFPSSPCPPGFGAILYYTVDQVHWEILGSIFPEKPSATFRTGWPTNDLILNAYCVYLGVSLEP